MAIETCTTGTCLCSMGLAPAIFQADSSRKVETESNAAGTIEDNRFTSFGMCTSLMNPDVMKATIAAAGVLTPQPCSPQITMPWMPGSANVLIGNIPALGHTSQLMCSYMGIISFVTPGEMSTHVPM